MASGKKQRDQSLVADTNWNRYCRARDSGHLAYISRANVCDAYYCGDQWNEQDKAKLESIGRPALTINTILPTVNTVLGEQASRRAEIQYKNKRGGTSETAHVLTKLSMAILDENDFDQKESEVFADGLIVDRGFYDIRVDFEKNVQGDVVIDTLDPRDVIIDPDAQKYDPTTWKEVFITKWMALDEIEQMWGKKKRSEIEGVVSTGEHYGYDSIRFNRQTFGDTSNDDVYSRPADDNDFENIRKVRVIERQYFMFDKCYKFVRPETGDTREVPANWSDKRRDEFAQANGLMLINTISRKVRWTVTVDRVVLHDDWSPYVTFTVVPYFCYFRRGRPFGMVRNLISPQDQLNKLSSQELHVVNTTANSGWIFESGSLVGMDRSDLTEKGAETGLVLEVAPGRTPPAKIQPNQIPTGLDRISQKAAVNIKEISGISDAMLGQESAEVSGVALENKERRGQVQISKPLDNLAYTRRLVARKLMELIQQFYTEQRIIYVTNENDPKMPQEQMTINDVDPTSGAILNDVTVGEYEVAVSSMPSRDSYDEVQFAEMISLLNAGIPIPAYQIVLRSHLARKDALAEEVKQLTGLGEPTEEELAMQQQQQELMMRAQMAEIEKLEAEVANLQAQAELAIAKAAQTNGGTASPEHERFMADLEQKTAMKRAELRTKMDIAQLNARTKLQATTMQNAAKNAQMRLAAANKTQPERKAAK